MIRFPCPQCRGVLEAPESNSGDQINCLRCGYLVQIPVPPNDYFRFPCPSCGKRLKAKPEYSGKKTHCIKCGTHLIVPSPKGHSTSKPGPSCAPTLKPVTPAPPSSSSPVILVSPDRPLPESARRADSKACPFCGEQVLAVAKKCKHCGELIDVALRATEDSEGGLEEGTNNSRAWKIASNLTKIASNLTKSALSLTAVLALALAGAVAGWFFVRIFMFDERAELAWNNLWVEFDKRNINVVERIIIVTTRMVVPPETAGGSPPHPGVVALVAVARKLLAGTIIGGTAGLIIGMVMLDQQKKRKRRLEG